MYVVLCRKGDVGRAVFFVTKGTVEGNTMNSLSTLEIENCRVITVISEDAEIIYAELTDGALFGEIGSSRSVELILGMVLLIV